MGHDLPPIEPAELEHPYDRDETILREALLYITNIQERDVFKPDHRIVEQPDYQVEMIETLKEMLAAIEIEHGNPVSFLETNLRAMRVKQFAQTSMPTQLCINLTDSKAPEDSSDSSFRQEYLDGADPYAPNTMITSLIVVTGAEVLSYNPTDERGSFVKRYKGMFNGKPVYFEEEELVIQAGPNSEPPAIRRMFSVIGESTMRSRLEVLTARDLHVLKSLSIAIPPKNLHTIRQGTYMKRSDMVKLVEFYAHINGVALA